MSESIKHLDFDPEDPKLRKALEGMGESERAQEEGELATDGIKEWLEEERQAIFGQEELTAVEGHEASPESTQALLNAIKTLTQEKTPGRKEYKFQKGRKLQRYLNSRDENGHLQQEVWLDYYPDGAAGVHAANVSDLAVVDLVSFRSGERVVDHYGNKRRVATQDDLYIDRDTGEAVLSRTADLSLWNQPNHKIGAHRQATEQEVQEALDLITKLVQEENQRQTVQVA